MAALSSFLSNGLCALFYAAIWYLVAAVHVIPKTKGRSRKACILKFNTKPKQNAGFRAATWCCLRAPLAAFGSSAIGSGLAEEPKTMPTKSGTVREKRTCAWGFGKTSQQVSAQFAHYRNFGRSVGPWRYRWKATINSLIAMPALTFAPQKTFVWRRRRDEDAEKNSIEFDRGKLPAGHLTIIRRALPVR